MTASHTVKMDIASTTSPLSQTDTDITTYPCRLHEVYINIVLSGHTIDLVDFNADASPQTSRVLATIPATAAAGNVYRFADYIVRHRLRVVTNAAATGNITVGFAPKIN